MVTVQISIPERSWANFSNELKEIKEYYEEKLDDEFGDKAFLWDYSGGQRTAYNRRKINNSFVICQAVGFFCGEIQRLRKEEKKKEESDETSSNDSFNTQTNETKPWRRSARRWGRK